MPDTCTDCTINPMNTDNPDRMTCDGGIEDTSDAGCSSRDACTDGTSSADCATYDDCTIDTGCMDRASGTGCPVSIDSINCNDANIRATCIGSPDYADRSTWVGQIGRAK